MNNEIYFRSITDEVNALQNKVRNFITNHWPTDGQWKESVLRTILRRHLPQTISIGTGFIVSETKTSNQIDILLYDNSKPVLFKDNEFVIVTPDGVRGIIEVKTSAVKSDLESIFSKLADDIAMIPTGHSDCRFFGVFFYEGTGTLQNLGGNPEEAQNVLTKLFNASEGSSRRTINCISIGDSFFARYWIQSPEGNQLVERWHAYYLENKAPAYFIHNVIEHLCPDSVLKNNAVWYPETGKESCKIAEQNRQNQLPVA